jgi:hypothetical protein
MDGFGSGHSCIHISIRASLFAHKKDGGVYHNDAKYTVSWEGESLNLYFVMYAMM